SLEAYAHQDVPFEQLVEELQPERDLSHMPLVQVLFAFQNTPDASLDLPGLTLSGIEADNGTARFDLSLDAWETERGIVGFVRYKSDLFDAAAIERLLGHFQSLLASIVINPDERVNELKLLTAAEQKQLQAWNATEVKRTRAQLLHKLFEEQAARTPDSTALSFKDESLTYRELNERANRLAHFLRRRGVRADELVAVACERSIEMVLALLGVLKAGGAYVPLDPNYPQERLSYMLSDCGARVLITQERLREKLPETTAELFFLDSDAHELDFESYENPQDIVVQANMAYMIYTSGSTGRPKGAMNTHEAICNRLLWMQEAYGLDETDAVLQKTPFSFDVSVWEFFWPLLTGARLVMAEPRGHQDAAYLVETIKRERVTTLHFVPSMLQLFLEERELKSCDSLRRVICSGEALSAELQEKFFARVKGVELHNLYGPTEAAVDVTSWKCVESSSQTIVPIGLPIANTQVYVLDPSLNLLPVGVAGELYIGGVALARGYHQRPDMTAERFIPHPFSQTPGARLYKTGDKARRLSSGEIEFLGRLDYQVKLRGFRIELGEIEAALAQHAGVREAVAVAREDAGRDKTLVCYLVSSNAEALNIGELREFLQARLPEYMIPSHFIFLDELPLTPNGKLDRKALPAPDAARPELKQEYVKPLRPLEILMAAMWSEMLGVEQVGLHDNFFELGGNSIEGAIFINHLQEKLGEIIHVVTLFTSPTIARLAAYLEEHYAEAVARLSGVEAEKNLASQDEHATTTRVSAEQIEQARELVRHLPPREARAKVFGKNPQAIFILSPPRSGSTLLRVMLAGHPELFAPPELELLNFNTLSERAACFAGAQSFWLEGALRAVMEAVGCSPEEAMALMREYEESGFTTQQFYARLQQWLKGRRLVDKTPSYSLDAATLLRAEEDFENPLYIHLVRNPYAMIHSFEEAKMDQIFFGGGHPFKTRELAEIVWHISHQNILEFLRGVPQERQHRLRFEELVTEPEETLEALCRFLKLELHPAMLQPYQEQRGRMTDGLYKESRMLGDVKFHRHNAINSSVADRWTEKYQEDFLGESSRELAARLGYNIARTDEVSTIPRAARNRTEQIPLSFAQQRLFFLDKVVPRKSAYNIPIAVRIHGALDAEALLKSLHEIVKRHESLRTSFPIVDGV
ncbi:MAG: amino acid adenylation domain-containing protein, partial [Acidobacteria bacterium]|nr:amino acid adenylation domain-containing protein [Acidobacteriota bacterium]